MTGSMSSEQIQRLIAGYVLGDLSPEEAATLEQWIAANPALAQEVEQVQKALEVAYAPPEIRPPAHLRASILEAHHAAYAQPLRATSTSAPPRPLLPPQPDHRWAWVKGLGAVAALLIVGLSISNYVLWRSLQVLQAQMQQPTEALTVSLEPADTDIAGSVTVLIDPTNLEATLKVDNLPPLPDGQVYALWTVLQPDAPFTTDDKNAILTQVFTVEDQGRELEQIPLPRVYRDRQWIRAIAVTVESANAPQLHESSPILIEML